MKKIILFNIIIVIIIFLSLEFSLRVFNIITLQGFEKDTFYKNEGVVYHYPNVMRTIMGKKIRTDNNGFRVPLEKINYKNNLQTILILGDSVSFGVGVNEKDSFVGLLRKKINYNLYNSSVAGHRLENYSFLLEKYHNKFQQINEVLIFLCLNDIVSHDGVVQKERFKIASENKSFWNDIRNKRLFIKLNFFLREKSTVFNIIKAVGTKNVKRHFDYINPYYENEIILNKYKNSLKKIIDYSNLNKINTRFVLLPYKHQIKNSCEARYMLPQTKIKDMFQELKYRLFDFSTDFCNKDQGYKLFLNFDPMHLSKDGHKFVSQLILKKGIVN